MDCPSFLDSRGWEINVGSAVNVCEAVSACSSVKDLCKTLVDFFAGDGEAGVGQGLENLKNNVGSIMVGLSQTFKADEEVMDSAALHAKLFGDTIGLDDIEI